MSINNIVLSPQTLGRLYESTLIGAGQQAGLQQETKIKHLGANNKNIVFLVNNPHHAYAGDEEMVLLTNLLGACKLSMEDIALVNYYDTLITDQGIRDEFSNNILIIFGVSGTELKLPFNVPHFQKYEHGKCTYLFNPDLNEFLTHPALKKNLWQCLKIIFKI